MSVWTQGYLVYALAYNPILCFLKKDWFLYLAVPGLRCSMGNLVSWPGMEPSPLHSECGVSVPGPPGKCASPMFFFCSPELFQLWPSGSLWTDCFMWLTCFRQLWVFWFGLVLGTCFLSSTVGCFRHLLYFLASLLQSVLFPRNPGSFSWIMLREGNIWVQDVFAAAGESLLLGPPSWRSKETA